MNPSLLHRENATGRTPLEMSQDIYVSSSVADAPNMSSHFNYYHGQHDSNSLFNKAARNFAPPKLVLDEEPEDWCRIDKKRTYEICMEIDNELRQEGYEGEAKRKRRLVSLFEANEVAKRLAGMKRSHGGKQLIANGYLVDVQGKPDVVSQWLGGMTI